MKDLMSVKKSNYKRFLILIFICSVISTSCIDDTLNVDQKMISPEELGQDGYEGGFLLPDMMGGILSVESPATYQLQTNMFGDEYAGYMGKPKFWNNNFTAMTYAPPDGWIARPWSYPLENVLDQWLFMKRAEVDTKFPDLYAIAIILKTFAGHRHVDMFGPIPYSRYGDSAGVKFDSEEEAYDVFFSELRKAVNDLKQAKEDNPDIDQIRFAKFDRSQYSGDYEKWIKLANTLRLRLAMRIAYVNPSKAQTEAEDAVSAGVLTNTDGSFGITTQSAHPLSVMTLSWNANRLGAPVGTILGGYNDPRLAKYAFPATDPDLEDQIIGIRTGIEYKVPNYNGFSAVNFEGNPPLKLLDVSESYFLRAEGALRGWDMGGTAKYFYEQGIRTSFGANGVDGIEDYLNDSTSTPNPYVDPYNSANNAPPLTSITIKWDFGSSFEQKLERIITQKWIAMFPDGQEAWSEFRRTGYPKLYPVMVNHSKGIVPDGEFIKRVRYPSLVYSTSEAAVTEAVTKYLDGKDDIYTPIWWDVKN